MSSYWLADLLVNLEEQEMSKLAPAEQEFADALMNIAKKYGKLADYDENGIWVGYVRPEENDNLKIGVKCSNCYFYESENVCAIIKESIQPGGYCRLAAIPPGLVDSSKNDDDDDDMDD